jgi:hypothetical protein
MLFIPAVYDFGPILCKPTTELPQKPFIIAAEVPEDWMKVRRAASLKLQLPVKPAAGKDLRKR